MRVAVPTTPIFIIVIVIIIFIWRFVHSAQGFESTTIFQRIRVYSTSAELNPCLIFHLYIQAYINLNAYRNFSNAE